MTDVQYLAWLEAPDSIKLLLVEVVVNISGVETTLYLANIAYSTGAADTPANTTYQPFIRSGGVTNETLSLDGSPSISYGSLGIDNSAGVRDSWLDSSYVWVNRRYTSYLGDPRWPRADFRLIYDGIVDNLDSTDPEQLDLHFLDKLSRLNVPISETLLGGATNNKDAIIPQAFGEMFNITPLLQDPATLKYRYNLNASEGCIEPRDNGAPVSFTDSPASGYFVLNQSPVGTITCSVQGDKPSGVYSNNIVSIVENILLNYGPAYTRLVSGDLDTTQLAAFAAAHTQPVGLYSQGRTNVLAACQQLAASVGAQIVTSSVGKVRLIQLSASPAGTPTVITSRDFEEKGLAITQRVPVRAAVKVGYCQNWTVQATGLAGGLPPSNARLFQDQWQFTTQSDATALALFKLDSAPVQEDSLLLRSSDAVPEAQRRCDLWKVQRTIYTVKCRAHLLLTELGDPITLVYYRFGLAGGKTGMAIQIQRDWMNNRVTIGVLI